MYQSLNFVTLVCWTAFVVTGAPFIEWMLRTLSNRFAQLRPSLRRKSVKNLFKSGLLLVLSFLASYPLYELLFLGKPDNGFIRTTGLMYAIPDLFSLYWVWNALDRSTVYHHFSVGFLATVGIFLDHTEPTHWLAMLVYAYLSMLAGCVNFYMGIRFLLDRKSGREDWYRMWLARFCLTVYVLCCTVNWSYQLYTLVVWTAFRVTTWATRAGLLAYCTMMVCVVRDDLILIRWLGSECRPYLKENQHATPTPPPLPVLRISSERFGRDTSHFLHALADATNIDQSQLVIQSSDTDVDKLSVHVPSWSGPIDMGCLALRLELGRPTQWDYDIFLNPKDGVFTLQSQSAAATLQ
jgi:hypothetical protein